MTLLANQENKNQDMLVKQRQELNDAQVAALAAHRFVGL